MRIDRLDHLVLTVADVGKTVRFYVEALGMEEVVFGEGRKALAFGRQKINLHERGAEIEPKAFAATPGSEPGSIASRRTRVSMHPGAGPPERVSPHATAARP